MDQKHLHEIKEISPETLAKLIQIEMGIRYMAKEISKQVEMSIRYMAKEISKAVKIISENLQQSPSSFQVYLKYLQALQSNPS